MITLCLICNKESNLILCKDCAKDNIIIKAKKNLNFLRDKIYERTINSSYRHYDLEEIVDALDKIIYNIEQDQIELNYNK